MAHVCTDKPGVLTGALQHVSDGLKMVAQQPFIGQHLHQAGVKELLKDFADELLSITAPAMPLPATKSHHDHTMAVKSQFQNTADVRSQHEYTAAQPARYSHLDVNVEEI